MLFRVGLVACVLAFACSPAPSETPAGDAGDDGDAADARDAPFVPAQHALPPPIPTNGGGALASANLVVVTFAGYAFADDVEAMVDWLPTSSWLAATGAEYGVGTPTVLAKVRLGTAAPSFTSASDFTTWLAGQVGNAIPAPPSASTVYAVIFPSGASFSDPSLGSICGSFTGYHDAAAARAYAFAAIGTCPGHVAGLTDVEQVERVLSHEIIEALTDPFGDGYAARDPEDPWSYVSGGEVADVCNGFVREGGFLAVRSWSNAAAAAGLDPCEPNDAGAIYFGVASSTQSTLHVAAGASTTIELTGFSTAPTSDWAAELVKGANDFVPAITFAPGPMNNGRVATMTIGVPQATPAGSKVVLSVRSFHAGDATYTLEPIVVRTL